MTCFPIGAWSEASKPLGIRLSLVSERQPAQWKRAFHWFLASFSREHDYIPLGERCLLFHLNTRPGEFQIFFRLSSLLTSVQDMSAPRCGPKSIYTQEQDQWLEQVKDDFVRNIEEKKGKEWETTFKKDKASAFVKKFSSSLTTEEPPEVWVKVCASLSITKLLAYN